MIDKAIAKITDEMMKANNNFAQFIEEYLTSICTTDAVAAKLLDPKKSLKEFTDDVIKKQEEAARKQGTGLQCVGAPDSYFLELAEQYYGITEEDKASVVAVPAEDIIDISDFL